MRHVLALAATAAVSALLAGPSHAQLVQSRFDAGTEGWLNVMLPYPEAVPVTIYDTFTPAWSAGTIQLADPDGSGAFGNAEYWQAPAAFLGDRSAAYGDSLTFDVRDVGSGYGGFSQEDVVLTGGGLTISCALPSPPDESWTHGAVPLTEAGWHVGALSGPAVTHAQFVAVLGALTQLFIRAEYQLGPDTQYLDNVVLGAGTAGVGPAGRAAAPELSPPVPNPSAGAALIAFTLPGPAAADLGVFDAAGRRVATVVHGFLGAGRHAARWDGTGRDGRDAGPGLYWVRLAAGPASASRKLLRLR